MNEKLILPPQYGGIEADWPFTRLGKEIDSTAKKLGFELQHKEFCSYNVEMDYDDEVQLKRTYKSPATGLELVTYRQMPLPQLYLNPEDKEIKPGVELKGFRADEFTCYNNKPLISPQILIEKLKGSKTGSEDVFIHSEDATEERLEMNVHYTRSTNKKTPYTLRISCFENPAKDYLTTLKGFMKYSGKSFEVDLDADATLTSDIMKKTIVLSRKK